MLETLEQIRREHQGLEQALADPALLAEPSRYREVTRRYGELGPIVELAVSYQQVLEQIEQTRPLLNDPELGEIAQSELVELDSRRELIERSLQVALLPHDPDDDKNAIVEIRQGTGGEEAALFAAELLQMYLRYAERKGLAAEILDTHTTELGGISKVAFQVVGPGAYGAFKYESGVHRVQRVPETETSGRIHTSTASVAILPEAQETDLELDMSEIRIDVQRASGPGGQGVNTTDSAVRVLHIPTGMIVTCQDSRSQIKNREKALTILRSRLLEIKRAEEDRALRERRLSLIGSGERAEKIRTYNFPQSRVTDHRVGFTTHDLTGVLNGNLDDVHQALALADQERTLSEG